jgi:hypothetical protein
LDWDGLDPLLRCFPRAAEEQERQRHADPGQHDEGQEGGLEALVQHDERVGTFVCCHEQIIATVAGSAAFDGAVSTGRALSLERAVDDALLHDDRTSVAEG